MLRVGLTGGIACGKSHVLARLAQAGCHTIDLDRVAHEAMAPGRPAHAEIVASFGPEVVGADGAIDRKLLGARVFADRQARSQLNAIVHPRVRAQEADWAEAWRDDPRAVVVSDAALLVESGVHLRFERLVVVHCSPEEQLGRLMRRDGSTQAAAEARIAAQMPLAEKRRFAHLEIDTSGRHEDTDAASARLAEELLRIVSSRPDPAPAPRERGLGCLLLGPSDGPGGLGVRRFLELIAARGGLEMAELASAMGREAPRPWYEPERSDRHPASLAGPLVLYSLARVGRDADFLASAAASLGRLVEKQGAVVTETCLHALLLADVAAGLALHELRERAETWRPLALRWGGAAPSPRYEALLDSAGSGAFSPERDVAGLLGALRGMAQGPGPEPVDAGLEQAVETLARGMP